MSEEFNKEFLKLSEKDQKAIINLIQLKNMNKKDEYKKRIDKAIEYIETNVKEHIHDDYDVTLYYSLNQDECDELLEILKGDSNE